MFKSDSSEKLSCLTDHGRKWLEVALDPYHDTTLELMGFPDANGSPSFVIVVKNTVVVSSPVTTTPSWACHVGVLPINAVDVHSEFRPVSLFPVAGAFSVPNYSYSGYDVNLGPVFYTTTVSTSSRYESWLEDSGGPTVTQGLGGGGNTNGRVIACAFEVTDVTPKLYQQGSCTVYTAPQAEYTDFSCQFTGTANTFQSTSQVKTGPPNNLSAAQLIPNTRTWAASEGAYVVGRITSVDNPPQSLTANFTTLTDNGITTVTNPYPSNLLACVNGGGFSTMACSGAIFSGLNPSVGALRITSRVVYEVFPRASVLPQDPYLPLTSPSAPFDACAFQMYAEAVKMLPPGVPVRMNAAGDWFRMVVRSINDSGVLNAIHPALGMIGRGVNQFVNPSTNAKTFLTPKTPRMLKNRKKAKKVMKRKRVNPR